MQVLLTIKTIHVLLVIHNSTEVSLIDYTYRDSEDQLLDSLKYHAHLVATNLVIDLCSCMQDHCWLFTIQTPDDAVLAIICGRFYRNDRH